MDLNQRGVLEAMNGFVELYAKGDIEGILEAFTDDVRGRFGMYPPFKGKHELRAMMETRFKSIRDYELHKNLELICAPQFVASWTGNWLDVTTNQRVEVFGVEVVTVRDGKICEWTAASSSAPIT